MRDQDKLGPPILPPAQPLLDENKPEPSKMARAIGSYAGTPLAIAVVWYLNTFWVKGEMPIEAAVVVGSLVNQVATTAWHIISQLLGKVGIET